jgi:hypothetical protein
VDLVIQPNSESGILEAYVEFLDSNVVRVVATADVALDGKKLSMQRCKVEGYASWDYKQVEQKHVLYGI